MNCDFIGRRRLIWWQRVLAACCSLLCISVVTMVQEVQRRKQSRQRAPKLKTRTRIHSPVTVLEYVKSWMRDISNVLPVVKTNKDLAIKECCGQEANQTRPSAKLWTEFSTLQAPMESTQSKMV
jgi:hypothetical protein